MRVFTTYQVATVVTNHGFKKIRPLKTQDGEFRYQIKGLTEDEWKIYEHDLASDEPLTDQEIEDLVEPGGWMILDGFTAGGVKRLYEALGDTAREKFDSVPIGRIAAFMFARAS